MIEWRIPVAGDATTAVLERSVGASSGTFILAHGAGGNRADRGMAAMAALYRALGLDVVRFNFLYREKRVARPDPMPLLQACVAAVAARAREELRPRCLFVGGRSMGGRAASMLAARGFDCDGLILLAYPLHPAGKPEQLRDAHLPEIAAPVLCLNGTRDALCRQDLMNEVSSRMGDNWTMYWLEGADHSFHVLKSSGRTDADVLAEISEVSARWLASRTR